MDDCGGRAVCESLVASLIQHPPCAARRGKINQHSSAKWRFVIHGFRILCRLVPIPKKSLKERPEFWIAEFSELTGVDGKEAESIRAFLSRQTDKARPAYGRRSENVKRQWVPTATTGNDPQYLPDNENRRWWPIKVIEFDIAAVEADRDQLWAEAKKVQDAARKKGAFYDRLMKLFGNAETGEKGWTTPEAVWNALCITNQGERERWEAQMGKAMRLLGFERLQVGADKAPQGPRGARYYQREDVIEYPNPVSPIPEATANDRVSDEDWADLLGDKKPPKNRR